ncbi:MAG: Tn3 family transposase [Flammeovirgaceae bacterium]|nr:Tn3 family transposase [Flammeovirgaceae bacterium]
MSRNLDILSENEQEVLYGLPLFGLEDRKNFFTLSKQEWNVMSTYRGVSVKLNFMLQLGYFKATKQFYTFEFKQVKSDIEFLQASYFPVVNITMLLSNNISPTTHIKQQKKIARVFGYRFCRAELKRGVLKKAKKLVRTHAEPHFIFRELLVYLQTERIILPRYSVLQREIISRTLLYEEARLSQIVSDNLSENALLLLDKLLDTKEGISLLAWLQKEPANFNYGQMQQQIERKKTLTPYYKLAVTVVKKFRLSNENIAYYALLSNYYSIYQLKQRKGYIVYVYLLCFVYIRWLHINDLIIEALLFQTKSIRHDAKTHMDKQDGLRKVDINQHLQKLPHVLEILTSDQAPKTLFSQIQQLIYQIINPDELGQVKQYLQKQLPDKERFRWQYYEGKRQWTTMNIRPLCGILHFDGVASQEKLLKAIDELQAVVNLKKKLTQKLFPAYQEVIPPRLETHICPKDNLYPPRYECYLYQSLRNKLESGDILVNESLRYRSFEQDLISPQAWKDKETLIRKSGLEILQTSPQEILKDWKKRLENGYKTLNDGIRQGKNTGIELISEGNEIKWKWQAPGAEEGLNHRFYAQFPVIQLAQLLAMVDEHTGFLSEFTHLLDGNQKPDKKALIACLIALGTNYSLYQMASISDISFHDLHGIYQHFIREKTLKPAADIIINASTKLPVYQYYLMGENITHSSSDGQKFSTQFDTTNSRHAPKYFGLGKGVAAYSLLANNLPLNTCLFGLNEHESHYVFDIIYNNTSEIRPDIHSVDTHGTNQVNFAILEFFGYQLAPRYAKITDQSEKLCTFDQLGEHENYIIRATHQVNEELIIQEWENIQRIIISLDLKTVTQSTIIRKLSKYPRKNATRQALAEFDKIVKTDYILRYLESPKLQKQVQKALNRVEEYHKLQRKLRYANEGKFRMHSVQEQQIGMVSTRLLADAIIYYNSWLLSALMDKKKNDKKAIEKIKRISPIAWRNVHIHGRYNFSDTKIDIDWEKTLDNIKI